MGQPDCKLAAALPSAPEVGAARRSVRRYLPKPVPPTTIRWLLEAATAAPSAHNRQPWRFAVLSSGEHKARLARMMGDRLRKDRLADHDAVADVDADVARSFARITGAATVVVVCLSMEHMDDYPDAQRNRHEHLMAVQSTAMAGHGLLVAAHAQGLGACWLCAPLFCAGTVREALGLPGHWEPQGMVTIGYPAAAARPVGRRDLSEVALFLSEEP